MTKSNFRNNVIALRKKAGKSQEELAEDVGVSRQAVGGWEQGRQEPRICTLIKLSNIFGVTVDELVMSDKYNPVRKHTMVYRPMIQYKPIKLK